MEHKEPLFFLFIRCTFSHPSFSFSSKIVSCITSLLLLLLALSAVVGVGGGVAKDTSGLAAALAGRLERAL